MDRHGASARDVRCDAGDPPRLLLEDLLCHLLEAECLVGKAQVVRVHRDLSQPIDDRLSSGKSVVHALSAYGHQQRAGVHLKTLAHIHIWILDVYPNSYLRT